MGAANRDPDRFRDPERLVLGHLDLLLVDGAVAEDRTAHRITLAPT